MAKKTKKMSLLDELNNLQFGFSGLDHFLVQSEPIAKYKNDDEAWDELCEFTVAYDAEHHCSDKHLEKYQQAITADGFEAGFQLIKKDLLAADPFAALAIYRMNLDKHLPFININSQFHRIGRVYMDEFSIIRFLEWAGFDVSATENPSDAPVLHNFVTRCTRPSTNIRAVLWLLEHGADAQAVNAEGDNALITRSRSGIANSESAETFYALMNFGGLNPFTPAPDGATAYSLLAAHLADTRYTIDPALEDLVPALDAMHAEMVRSGTTATTKFGVLIS